MLRNPDYPNQRGCFIDPVTADKNGECNVVDYPTFSIDAGVYVGGMSQLIPEGEDRFTSFPSRTEALAFCAEQNYVVCSHPNSASSDEQ